MRSRRKKNRVLIKMIIIPEKKDKRKYEYIMEVVNLVVSCATILSLVLNACTLWEMREERKSAYRPYIQFSSIGYIIQEQDEMERIPQVEGLPVFNSEMGVTGSKITPELSLEFRNIGVGTAKDIVISISRESSIKAIEDFNSRSKYCNLKCTAGVHGDGVEFPDGTIMHLLYFAREDEIPYLLPNAEEVLAYSLPTVYYTLINAMRIEHANAYHDPFSEECLMPDIEILIEYSDVEGVRYKEKAYIHTEGDWLFMGGRSLEVTIISQEKYERMSQNNSSTEDTVVIETSPKVTVEAMG